MSGPALALGALLLAGLAGRAEGHYNLKDPLPYNWVDCNVPGCRGPCPPIWRSGAAAARNSPARPAATWARGQTVRVEWHRNNHEGGFYRRALVPVSKMNDAWWHKKAAFEWGCFTQGRYHCGRHKACGTDMEGLAYRNYMRVPTVFPDGDYVFAMVWFGGLHWRRDRAYFSDYHTCAFVRIRGGPLANAHYPAFVPGRNHRASVPHGKCASTSQFVGQCGGYECKSNPVRFDVAGVFAGGRRPPPVLLRDMQGAMGGSGVRAASTAGERRAIQKDAADARRDAEMARQQSLQQRKGGWRPKPKWTPPKKKWTPPQKKWTPPKKKWTPPKKKWSPRPQQRWNSACSRPPPPKAVGAWGPRHSNLWWNQRAKWWKRRNYCKQCRWKC